MKLEGTVDSQDVSNFFEKLVRARFIPLEISIKMSATH